MARIYVCHLCKETFSTHASCAEHAETHKNDPELLELREMISELEREGWSGLVAKLRKRVHKRHAEYRKHRHPAYL